MRERPILMNGEMVRAILDGRKGQTRRPLKRQPAGEVTESWSPEPGTWAMYVAENESSRTLVLSCPFGEPGDRLWVRETWCNTTKLGTGHPRYYDGPLYAADDGKQRFPFGGNWTQRNSDFKWTPSIHMPRWASRINLTVKRVWVERVQDISEADALAEGVPRHDCSVRIGPTHRAEFACLWESIYGTWDANPHVWACEFEVAQ